MANYLSFSSSIKFHDNNYCDRENANYVCNYVCIDHEFKHKHSEHTKLASVHLVGDLGLSGDSIFSTVLTTVPASTCIGDHLYHMNITLG